MFILLGVLAAPLAFAAPTDFNLNWNGAGSLGATWVTDGTTATFSTSGNGVAGSWVASDANNNPYGYGVDSATSDFRASVTGGGMIQYSQLRTGSYAPMYGPADQGTTSGVLSALGSATLNQYVYTNYADLGVGNYGHVTNNQFTASGDYSAYHSIFNGANGAGWNIAGTGSTNISDMTDTANGNVGWTLGSGGGCYTNAQVSASGSGSFDLGANSGASMSGAGWSTVGASNYSGSWSFASGFTLTDFHLSGN